MAKLPIGVIKNAGNLFAGTKKTPAPATHSLPDIPFIGNYKATIQIGYVGQEFANSKFVPSATNDSELHLECNGYPLVLPLDQMHPGFCGSVSLTPDDPIGPFKMGAANVSAADSTGCQDLVSSWFGECLHDGSCFDLYFQIRKHRDPTAPPYAPAPPTILSGHINCGRIHES